MKNHNIRIVSAISSITIISSVAIAAPTTAVFDLKNNTNGAIQFQIHNGPITVIAAKDRNWKKELDVKNTYTMNIYYCPTETYCKTKSPDVLISSFDPGSYETMYLKFSIKNGKGLLEPQKGTLQGTVKRTDYGFDLSKNIKEGSIIEQKIAKGGFKQQEKASPEPQQQTVATQQKTSPAPEKAASTSKSITELAWEQFPEANILRMPILQRGRATGTAVSEKTFPVAIWYAVLDLDENAKQSDIEKASKALLSKWHKNKHKDRKDLATEVRRIIRKAASNFKLHYDVV